MALQKAFQLLLAFYLAIVYLPTIFAQSATPANITLPTDRTPVQPVLTFKQSDGMTAYQSDTGLNLSSSDKIDVVVLENAITGDLLPVTPFTLNNLTSGDIAYISCDPSVYNTSNIDLHGTILGAVNKINSSSSTAQGPSGAIILYSTTSDWCNYSAPSDFVYDPVFVLPDAAASKRLEDSLHAQGQMQSMATIGLKLPDQQNSTQDSSDDGALGPSPTTTVAMIILYSITGIITLLFLIIIITGSIRAHRNPERYGPGAFLGGIRQGRAKGIARAMLETLPIVKFGEREASKPGEHHERDIELGRTGSQSAQETAGSTTINPEGGSNVSGPVPTNTTVGDNTDLHVGHHESSQAGADDEASPESQAEAGLACSVCTDDFIKGQDTRVLPCNHKFHPECIDPWLLNISGTCPLCRVDLRSPEPDVPEIEGLDGNASEVDDNRPYERRRIRHLLTRAARGVTAEQRVEALRDLRAANEATQEAGGDTTTTPRARTRVANRLSRFIGRTSTFEPPGPSDTGLSGDGSAPPTGENNGNPASRS